MSESRWSRRIVNPIHIIEILEKRIGMPIDTSHIDYNPKLKDSDFCIRRVCSHDGTLIFSFDLLFKVLKPILTKEYVPKTINLEGLKDIRYTISPIKIATVYGRVILPKLSATNRYPGQRESVIIKVKCEPIYHKIIGAIECPIPY